MTIPGIISAIGNNSSITPLFVRDCMIEVPTKIALTYNQNKSDKDVAKLAVFERTFDEYSTSAAWLGGIPLVGWCADKFIKFKGFNSIVDPKLFEEGKLQGLKYNIDKFKDIAPEAVQDLIKLTDKSAQKRYKQLLGGKFLASTVIPIAFMGFILPKTIFAISARRIENLRKRRLQTGEAMPQPVMRPNFATTTPKKGVWEDFNISKSNGQVAFTGLSLAKLSTVTTQDKMMITDGGYTVGRIMTARKKNEALDVGFRLSGMMFLNFVAPKWIEKGLNALSGIEIDPIMLADKEFIEAVRKDEVLLPENSTPEKLLRFVDENPDSMFVKYANKFKKIKMLENGVRDPREYVDFEQLGKFRNSVVDFIKGAKRACKGAKSNGFDNYVRRAKFLRSANVIANVGISSFLLAYCLPKVTFAFRKLVTGSELEPGLAPAVAQATQGK